MGVTRRILVTRPEPGASATAERLAALGHEPVLLPLTRIVPLEVGPDLPDSFDAVAFTSANGVRHAPAHLRTAIGERPVFCVGDATAEAARISGLNVQHVAAGNAVSLAGLLAEELPTRARVLHVAGRDRTLGFDEALVEAGIVPTVLEVYRAEPIVYEEEALQAILGQRSIDVLMIYSPRAGRLLVDLARSTLVGEVLKDARLLCISDNVAASVAEFARGPIAVAASPDEGAMIGLL